jgi:putative tributyrin esterase
MGIPVYIKIARALRAALSSFGAAGLNITGRREARNPQSDHPRLAPGVTVQDVSFFSAALNRQMTYRVFLPVELVSGQLLPVVYLLHGQGDDYRTWSNYTDVARYAALIPPGGLILVMPEGASSYYTNAAGKPEDKYQDYLVDDLISDVEARFQAAKGRANRAIIGISMGGFAVVKLALSRPELFIFAGALSPAIDVTRRRFTLRSAEQWLRFRIIFGPRGSKTRDSSDPFLLVRSANPEAAPYLYLSAGEQESLVEPNRLFAACLRERQFSYEFHTTPGGHNWGEWNAQIPACFESLLQHLNPIR